MKIAALFLALALGGAALPAKAPAPLVTHEATMALMLEDGLCSGTAIGPQLLLTASHCFEGGALVAAGKQRCKQVGEAVEDGNDHTIIRVSCAFPKWASLGGPMYVGQEIHLWGFAGALGDLFRRGYVMGVVDGWTLTDVLVFRGDSGAAIFDKAGYIVGVVSTQFALGETFHGMGSRPIVFSRKQLESAGL